jgi:uncharacterized membrane protein
MSVFLITRGLWLIVLEFTVVNFAWSFNVKLPFIGLTVIWALGLSMIALAGIIHLRMKLGLALGLILVCGHNLLDNIHFDGFFWSVLHETKIFRVDENHLVRVGYPVLPWIGIMILGYCFGRLYTKDFTTERRKKWLLIIGAGAGALFILIRAVMLLH